ncbi:MAG: HAMP domain-containing protein [Leptospiraceae bacterium]|nr:HAMP domain-containing protein [Leptospiraceae bacterium]
MKAPANGWQQEERKLYYRDILFILFVIVASILLAEYFLIRATSTAVDRIFSYLLIFLPLGILTVVAQLVYRNRRIRKTGNLRSSLRYRLTIAFLLISIVPSIPIFLISSSNVEIVLSALFNRNIRLALQDGHQLLEYYQKRELERLWHELGINSRSVPVKNPQFIVRHAFDKGVLALQSDFALQVKFQEQNMQLVDVLYQPDERLELPAEYPASRPWQHTVFRFAIQRVAGRDYALLFIPLQEQDLWLLLAHRLHPGMERQSGRFNQMEQNLQSEQYLNKNVPDTLRLGLALIYIFMIFMAFVIGIVLARQISNPVVALAAATRALTEGDLDARLDMKASGEIGILIDSFNQMTAELRILRSRLLQTQRMAAWQEVARRLAHEIKNPLTPISLSADRMLRRLQNPQKGNLNEVVRVSASTIKEQVEVLRTLVEEFANFARLPKAILKMADLNEIIREAAAVFLQRSIQIELQLAVSLPLIPLDRTLIIGLINNLVKNAVEAVAAGLASDASQRARIQISSSFYQQGHRKYVCLMVADSGPGIPEEMIERIFEPYYSTKTAEIGRGLGLALVQRAVFEHDASINVSRSASLGGAMFTVFFRIREL